MSNSKEQKWKTADGKEIPLSHMSQQHLSNCYWYHLIFNKRTNFHVLNELIKRFNAEILSWTPVFIEEIEDLKKMNRIAEFDLGDRKTYLIYETEIVGFVWKQKTIGRVDMDELRSMNNPQA